MTEGLKYSHWVYQDSRCHLLEIDLNVREFRPTMDKQEFPFNSGHPQTKAIENGAVACGPGGYNITLYHELGIQDQPQHALVVDGEIWTTGLGAGGYGVLIGDTVTIQRNRVQVHLWAHGNVVEVEHVNRGHEGEIVMFTPRGGTNEYPKYKGKWFYVIRDEVVTKIQNTPPKMWDDTVVIESTYDLGLQVLDAATLKKNLGADNVDHIMSGWPQIVRDGENIVGEYEMDPTESHGPDAWFVQRNPRTAIGCSEDGKTAYMLCVEGRLPNTYLPNAEKSRGLRLKGLAETAVKHGIYDMVNMDGGGSAFQWSTEAEIFGCYNTSETIQGQRRAHFSASVY
jgi:hypothetical protein